MNSRITKISAAAAVLILVAFLGWFYSNPDSAQQITSFTFLSRAAAAERTLFYGPDGIVHIVNQIILYPKLERDASDLLGCQYIHLERMAGSRNKNSRLLNTQITQ